MQVLSHNGFPPDYSVTASALTGCGWKGKERLRVKNKKQNLALNFLLPILTSSLNVFQGAPSPQRRRVYINKCCPEGLIYSDENTECVEDPAGRNASLAGLLGLLGPDSALEANWTAFDHGFPRCDDGSIAAGQLGDRGARLLPNGALELPTTKVNKNIRN